MEEADRAAVDGQLEVLAAIGAAQQPRPLEDPRLWGDYEVAYTSTRRSQERGQPAGGRFRGAIGRRLFATAGLFQSVIRPDIATNKIAFKLFGLFPGAVGLRGKARDLALGTCASCAARRAARGAPPRQPPSITQPLLLTRRRPCPQLNPPHPPLAPPHARAAGAGGRGRRHRAGSL